MTVEQLSSYNVFLNAFESVLPRHCITQEASLDWMSQAHSLRASALLQDQPADRVPAYRRMAERFGCGADRITRRYHEPIDFQSDPHAESLIFGGLTQKMAFYGERISSVLDRLYPQDVSEEGISPVRPPREIIHVTCTGYLSPSPVQKKVAELGWSSSTRVTHAYHMGCYASLPAVRIAEGALRRDAARDNESGKGVIQQTIGVDLVHTEVCSLHFAPGDPRPEQWVIQSLFADGHIRYRAHLADRNAPPRGRSMELLALEERILPGTEDQMTWTPGENGFVMTLGREVPREIARALPGFVSFLGSRSVLSESFDSSTIFAIHPGGPRIIDASLDALRLSHDQVKHSRAVLKERGNMSSATLPHVWKKILEDLSIPSGTRVVSLAFGPGLTVFGAVFRITEGVPE